MPIQLVRSDITKMSVDAIVNTSNNELGLSGGVNGAIHKAAGPKLLKKTLSLGGCRTGEAKITAAYNLPCKHVIHTVGPVWRGGNHNEEARLISCYRRSLELALVHGCKSVAFPLISAGTFGYPKEQALRVAMNTCSAFLLERVPDNDLVVYLVLFGKDCFDLGSKLFTGIEQYIDDNYVREYHAKNPRRHPMPERWDFCAEENCDFDAEPVMDCKMTTAEPCAAPAPTLANTLPESYVFSCDAKTLTLEDELDLIDESFSQMLLRKIGEKGMKNSDCYKRANIDKKLFSKINNDVSYKPRKQTALALAVALELSLPETRELLLKAGLALSRSDKFDIIVEYFIKQSCYDIYAINEALFYYDQPLLGSSMN